jgi:hypothetical protein
MHFEYSHFWILLRPAKLIAFKVSVDVVVDFLFHRIVQGHILGQDPRHLNRFVANFRAVINDRVVVVVGVEDPIVGAHFGGRSDRDVQLAFNRTGVGETYNSPASCSGGHRAGQPFTVVFNLHRVIFVECVVGIATITSALKEDFITGQFVPFPSVLHTREMRVGYEWTPPSATHLCHIKVLDQRPICGTIPVDNVLTKYLAQGQQ